MISIVLPYWDRQKAADKALSSIESRYGNMDLEIIVVDDGNMVPFVNNTKLDIKVLTLPLKDEPKSCITCWNEGVKTAKGDIIVLSCIEIIHNKKVLGKLTQDLGKNEYRLAAAWCPDNGWDCHSTKPVPTCPKGTGLSFCAAIHKDLYWKAGGFDEIYREGAGYEDRDFIWRLTNAGAKFVIRDDLVVIHPKTDAYINWGIEKFNRNKEIYYSRWFKPRSVICVNVGNYCGQGADYVNRLYGGVKMNSTIPFKFKCVTDDPTGFDKDIEVVPFSGSKDWYSKLYLFDMFDERVVFFDLDTLILGNIDPLLEYDGEMAGLRDFYNPSWWATGVMAFNGRDYKHITDEWKIEKDTYTAKIGLGDMEYIGNLDQGRYKRKLKFLQDLFPGMFASLKADCHPRPPEGTEVVCFHGQPRPHNAGYWGNGEYLWAQLMWETSYKENKHAA